MEVVSTILDSYLEDSYAITAQGNYAYVTSGGTVKRFTIIDFSDLDNPEIVGSLQDNTKLGNARTLEVDGDYAYVCAGDYDAILVIDISNKTNPYIVEELIDSTYLNYPSRMVKAGDYLYVSCAVAPYYFTIINVSDPLDISIEGYTDTVGVEASRSIAVYSDDYVFCCDKLVDVSDKSSPAYVKTIAYQGEGFVAVTTPYSSRVEGNYLFVDAYNSAYNYKHFSTVDVSDLDNSFIVSNFSTSDFAYSYDFEILGNYIYRKGGSFIDLVNISQLNNLICQNVIEFGYSALIDDTGDYFYNFSSNNLDIFDASDMSLVKKDFSISAGTLTLNAFQDGNYLIIGGNREASVVDVSDKENPSLTDSLYLYSSFYGTSPAAWRRDGDSDEIFYLNGSYSRGYNIRILDISNKSNISETGTGITGIDRLLDVLGGKIYTMDSSNKKIQVFSSSYYSELGSYTFSANYDNFKAPLGNAINGNYLYIIAQNQTSLYYDILVLDISNPSSISLVETFNMGVYHSSYYNYQINREADLLFCDYNSSIYVYDISDGISLKNILSNYFMERSLNRRQLGFYGDKVGISSSSSLTNKGRVPFILDMGYGTFPTKTIAADERLDIAGASLSTMGLHQENGYLYAVGDGAAYVITTREDPDPPVPTATFVPKVMVI